MPLSYTQIAIILLAAWIILIAAKVIVLTSIVGIILAIVAIVLVLADAPWIVARRRTRTTPVA